MAIRIVNNAHRYGTGCKATSSTALLDAVATAAVAIAADETIDLSGIVGGTSDLGSFVITVFLTISGFTGSF